MTFRILNHYAIPKLQKYDIEYIIICKADGGASFVVEVDYFKVSWPISICDENKHTWRAGMFLICKSLNEMKFKQRSFEDSIGNFFAYLMLICCLYGKIIFDMVYTVCPAWSCPGCANNFAREYFYISFAQRYFCASIVYNKVDPLSALQKIMHSNPTFLKLRCGIVVIKNSKTCKAFHFQAIKGLRLPFLK